MPEQLSFEIVVNGTSQIITSITQANKAIKEITKSFVLANQAGDFTRVKNSIEEINTVLAAKQNMRNFSRGMVTLAQDTNTASASSRQASMAMLNLNYVVRDSPYFFNNFAMGVMAIGNNLNPLIDSIIRAKQEAKNLGMSFASMMTKTLMGPSGLIFAMSLAVAAFQAITFAMSKSKSGANELTQALNSVVSKLIEIKNNPFEGLSFKLNKEDIDKSLTVINAIQKAIKEGSESTAAAIGGETGRTMLVWSTFGMGGDKTTDAVQKRLDAMKAQLEAEKMIADMMKSLGYNPTPNTKSKEATDPLLAGMKMFNEDWRNYAKETTKEIVDNALEGAKERVANEQLEDDLFLSNKKEVAKEWLNIQKNLTKEIDKPSQAETDKMNEVLKDTQKKMQAIDKVSNIMGNAISNAFLSGKNAIQAAGQALAQFIVQLATVQTMKGILTAIFAPELGFLGGFLSFANGGIVPRADNGMVVPGSSYSGDRILARLNSGEMILNQRQQSNLLKILSGKFSGERNNGSSNYMLSPKVTIDKQNLVIQLERTKTNIGNSRGLNKID